MPLQKHDTEYYLQAFKEGREEGFNHFFRLHYAPITYFALNIINNQAIAEEIASEAFIKLWKRHESFEHPNTIKSFLYLTVRNASIDHLRREKHKATFLGELSYISIQDEVSIEHHIIRSETMAQIYRALEALPPQCRQVFNLFYFSGKSYAEIAIEMGLSINTVRNHKARALALIKDKVVFVALWLFVNLLS